MKEHYQIANILIPVDFSERSKNAVEQSCGIAKATNARMILYHAYSRPTDGTNLTAHELEHRLELRREKIKEEFKAFTESIPELRECQYETRSELGISLQNIEQAFKSMDTDLMVMATHGARGVELMWGSKTTNLIKRLKGPILVMPDGANLKNPKKFCLAYNFDNKNQNVYALSTLKQIAKAFGAHIRIIDVRSHNYPKSDERLFEEEKISLFLGEDVSHDFESIFSKDVEHALLKYVHEFAIDMLAIMPAEHSFFEKLFHQSLTELMAAEIDIPLLTLVDK